jgi:hypothetical protein
VAFEGGGGGGEESTKGVKAVRFALESVILGKRGASILGKSDAMEVSDDESADDEVRKRANGERERGGGGGCEGARAERGVSAKKALPSAAKTGSLAGSDPPPVKPLACAPQTPRSPPPPPQPTPLASQEKPKMSAAAKTKAAQELATSRAVAAIELLVAHIGSLPALKVPRTTSLKALRENGDSDISSPAHTGIVFDTLLRIVEDSGMLPNTRDRKLCTDAKSKAAIRKAAGVGLIQLCNSSSKRDQVRARAQRLC